MLRWMSQEEFCAGERGNPYPADVPAVLTSLRAIPERKYSMWIVGLGGSMIGAAIRDLQAVSGRAYIPGTAVATYDRRRGVRSWLLLLAAALLLLAALGSGVALLGLIVMVLVVLPLAFRAVGEARVSAFVDRRTGLVGIDDGLPGPAEQRHVSPLA